MAFSTPDLDQIKNIDWRKVASYANPQSIKDLDQFLDKLPQRVGMNSIIVASIIWAIAGVSVLMAYTKAVDVQEIRKELTQAEALRPTVPILSMNKVSDAVLKQHVDKVKELYKNVTITQTGDSVKVTAASTRDFESWRAAIGDIAFGDAGWRLGIKEFCAGRDCQTTPLQATLSVQVLDIQYPDAKTE